MIVAERKGGGKSEIFSRRSIRYSLSVLITSYFHVLQEIKAILAEARWGVVLRAAPQVVHRPAIAFEVWGEG